jgi:hypothetical protein
MIPENEKKQKSGEISGMGEILARLRLNDSRKPRQTPALPVSTCYATEPNPLDSLITDLNGKNRALKNQEMDLKDESESDNHKDEDRSSGSDLFTPATESFDVISNEDIRNQDTIRLENVEMLRVRRELAAAKSLISRQEQELAETRTLKHTIDQAMGLPSEVDFRSHDVSGRTTSHFQSAFNASAPSFTMNSQEGPWQRPEVTRPDNKQLLSTRRSGGIWNDQAQTPYTIGVSATAGPEPIYGNSRDAQLPSQAYSMPYGTPSFPQAQHSFSGSGSDGRYFIDVPRQDQPSDMRRTVNRVTAGSSSLYRGYPGNAAPSPIGPPQSFRYQPRPIGTPLSATGPDFTVGSLPGMGTPWPTVSNQINLFRA